MDVVDVLDVVVVFAEDVVVVFTEDVVVVFADDVVVEVLAEDDVLDVLLVEEDEAAVLVACNHDVSLPVGIGPDATHRGRCSTSTARDSMWNGRGLKGSIPSSSSRPSSRSHSGRGGTVRVRTGNYCPGSARASTGQVLRTGYLLT